VHLSLLEDPLRYLIETQVLGQFEGPKLPIEAPSHGSIDLIGLIGDFRDSLSGIQKDIPEKGQQEGTCLVFGL
jgi:hypothetical protein